MKSIKHLAVSDPEILSGMPVFKGTRVPARTLFDYLEAGDSLDGFLDDFPTVTREQAAELIAIVRENLLAENCELVRLAETSFDVFITVDQNIPSQQNLRTIRLAIIILIAPNNQIATLRLLMPKVMQELVSIQPADVILISYSAS
jgi:uncharacterized protein (DUF433 family)